MNRFLSFLIFCLAGLAAKAQTTEKKTSSPDASRKLLTAEASCGKCKLGLPGKTCELAVRINGHAYYTVGAGIDDFGDAHAKDGFCNAIRLAEIQGDVLNDAFKLTYFKLLPETKKAEEEKRSRKN